MPVNPYLDFGKKCCIFVVQEWGIDLTWSIPLYFVQKAGEKSQGLVKISRRLVEISRRLVEISRRLVKKSQGFVEIIPGFF